MVALCWSLIRYKVKKIHIFYYLPFVRLQFNAELLIVYDRRIKWKTGNNFCFRSNDTQCLFIQTTIEYIML